MAEPELNPDVPNNSPSAVDGLLSILATVGLFALAAKTHKIALRAIPKSKLEAGRQFIAKAALKNVEAITRHPVFKTINKAFLSTKMVAPGPLDQIMREIDVSQLGIVQDLWTFSQLSTHDVKLRGVIAAEILTKAERDIPQLAHRRHQRLTLEDLNRVVRGTHYQEHVEKVLGKDGSAMGSLAARMGISRERFGKLRIDPWLFMDPNDPQKIYNISRLNPLRIFDKLEQVTLGGIPLFRMRSDPRGNKFGTAMFGSRFEDGKETTNPILKLLSGGKQDKGDVMLVGGVAWSRRSSRDSFELLDGPFNKKGQAAFGLTSDQRQGQSFFTHHASREMADEVLYGIEGKPKTDWQRLKRFLGVDVGARGGYSRGQHGTILDDILREPFGADERKRAWVIKHDPTGLLGSVQADDIRANRLGDIGSRSPMADAGGFSRLYIKSADPLTSASNWANILVSRPLYLMSKLGMNIRPGRTPLGTLGKVAALSTAAYMGLEGLKYADYALWDVPSKGAKYALGSAEYARQTALGAVGASEGIEGLEEELPGIVTSPLSKALRFAGLMIGGAVIGSKLGAPKWLGKIVTATTDAEATGAAGAAYSVLGKYLKDIGTKKSIGSKAIGGLILGTGAGGLLGAATSVGNLTASNQDVAERMRGDRKVPYRASSGWMLGRDPFSGGRIRFNRESRYNTFGTAYRDIGVYGSQANKWAYGSWLPTLQNWGGLRRFLNPYYAEDRNYDTRPYPATSGHFGDVPIFGSILQGTIGSLMKPTRYRDPYGASSGGPGGPAGGGETVAGTGGGYGSLSNMNAMSTGAGVGEGLLAGSYSGVAGFRGYGSEQLERMGFGVGKVLPMHANQPTGIGQTLSMQIRAIEEYIGLRGFQMQLIRKTLLGSAYPSLDRPTLATSGKMTRASRGYYDIEPGGMLGMTELPRRFLLRPSRQPTVNFIPNSIPNFLPGTLSQFERDRTWPIDFSRGDPYTKIPQGEARLPGPGYQALHKLHGGIAYTMLDSFIILADVAPFSQAYRVTKQEVDRLISEGKMDEIWIRKYQIAVEQAEYRSQFRVFHSRRYQGIEELTIKKAISPTEFTTYEQPDTVFSMKGTTISKRSDAAMLAQFQANGATARQAKAQVAAVKGHMFNFLKKMEGRTIDVSLVGSKLGYTEVEASSFIEEAESMGVGKKTSDLRDQSMVGLAYSRAGKLIGEAGFAGGAITGFLAGTARDFSIAQKGSIVAKVGAALVGAIGGGIAGGWIENKFTGDFTAAEHYERFNKYGTGYADWSTPVDSFLRTWIHSAASTVADYTPQYRQRQRDVEEYFDKLKFAKNKMLSSRGADWRELEPTMTSLDYGKLSAKTPGLVRAIPNSERQYFPQFAAEMDPEEQQRIVENVPEYMRSIYLSIWKNSQQGKGFANPELDHAYSEYVMPLINTSATERMSQYFESHAAPGPTSGFWHPSVSAEAVKYKTIEALGGNPHMHGLYSTQGAKIDAYQPDIANIADDLAASFGSTATREDFTLMQKMLRGRSASADLYAAPSFMFASNRGRIDIMQDDRERYREHYSKLALGRGIW